MPMTMRQAERYRRYHAFSPPTFRRAAADAESLNMPSPQAPRETHAYCAVIMYANEPSRTRQAFVASENMPMVTVRHGSPYYAQTSR